MKSTVETRIKRTITLDPDTIIGLLKKEGVIANTWKGNARIYINTSEDDIEEDNPIYVEIETIKQEEV